MNQQPDANAVTGQEDQQAAMHMYEIFSYLAQNPQQYAQVRQFMIDGDQIDPEDLPEQMSPEQITAAASEFGSVAQTGQMSGQMNQQAGIAGQFAGPAQMPQPGVADELAKYGRNGDTMVAHINPQEAQMLKMMGGAGTTNPQTGLPEYFSLKKFIKRISKPVIGATIGFFTGGPIGAVVGASAGEMSYQQSKATAQARDAAAEEARIMQEAENRRIEEARAEAERIRQAEIRRQENIAAGQNEIAGAFGQFDDNFYNQRMQSYMDFAAPQLDKQYEDQMRSLTASLARSGNLNSSLRAERMAQLQEEYDRGRLTLAEQGRGFADQARASTDAARARLMESNASLADPGTIRASAAAEASRLSINPQYANLGTLLSNLSTDVGASGPRSVSQASGGVQQYNTGFSGGAGRLVS
jgi:hypothetical protein